MMPASSSSHHNAYLPTRYGGRPGSGGLAAVPGKGSLHGVDNGNDNNTSNDKDDFYNNDVNRYVSDVSICPLML